MPTKVLTLRELNRATLARQMLLARQKMPALRAIEKLAGLQAQVPRAPFIALWSRLAGFRRADLAALIHARKAVRGTTMRGTIHLMTVADYLAFRGALQPLLDRAGPPRVRARLARADAALHLEEAARALGEVPQTFDRYRQALIDANPDIDHEAVVYAVQFGLPLVRIPDAGEWNFRANAAFPTAEAWLGRGLGPDIPASEMALRYLAAFGPATVADFRAWSGLNGQTEAFAEVRSRLAVFADERGRELFDLKRAPRPDAATPAPVRFLPDYDNVLLSHAERSRVIGGDARLGTKSPNGIGVPTFLVDGFVAGRWRIERDRAAAVLVLTPFGKLGAEARAELKAEGRALLAFIAEGAAKLRVRFGR
ncbi:winged helix DNA-binding domain-containing protein [soil metagenome]